MAPPKRPAHRPRRTYHHGNLRRALIDEALATIRDDGLGALTLREVGAAYVRFAVENPSHYRVMFSRFVDPEPQEPALAAEAGGAFQALVDAIVTLQREGLVRKDDT